MSASEDQLHLDLENDYSEAVITVGKVTFGLTKKKKKSPGVTPRKVLGETGNTVPQKTKQRATEVRKTTGNLVWSKDQIKRRLKLTRAACALLNSGGGMIRATAANEGYSCSRDGIGQDIEESFRKCILFGCISEYFDFVQEGGDVLIWVKSWSSENSSKLRLCSVETGLYQRSGESATILNDSSFIRRKLSNSGEEGMVSPMKRARHSSGVEMADDIRRAVFQFLERNRLELGETLGFAEFTVVDFKDFPRDCTAFEFLRDTLPRYASAFGNTEGGTLIFGVDDNRHVVGCKKSIDPIRFEAAVREIIDRLPQFHSCASKPKVNYRFKAQMVYDEDGMQHGYVFAVRIEPFCCLLFSDHPDSWVVEDGCVKRLTAAEWIPQIVVEDPDISKLAKHFTKELSLSDGPPMIKPVYSNRDLNSLDELWQHLFPASSDRVTFIPQSLCNQLFSENPAVKDLVEREIPLSARGTLMFSRSWAVDVGLPKNPAIVCDALLIAAGSYVYLFTVLESPSSEAYGHVSHTARLLKHKLVNVGGYSEKICVIPRVLCLSDDAGSENTEGHPLPYPSTYVLKREHLPSLQKSLIIVLLSFTSFLSDQVGVEFLNLLTLEQYEKLSKNLEKTPRQFIYGLPGSGKTIVALKIMEKIKNVFNCQPHEILYVCENAPLRDFVGKKMSRAVTRSVFMTEEFPDIRHIVVDEAQNFRVEDGWWYEKASQMVSLNGTSPRIFWIFMDYWQLSHPYVTGLPPLHAQYPQDHLTTGVRNAAEIYKIMDGEMKRIVENTKLQIPHQKLRRLLSEASCGHPMAGSCETKQGLRRGEMANYVAEQCRKYLRGGYSKKDIAILCSTTETTAAFRSVLVQEMRKFRLDPRFVKANEILLDEIVLDSIRRFSGLERPIVFGINPVPAHEEVSHNLLLCVASRANQRLHLLYQGFPRGGI